jgi:hypothetical protein
MPTQPLSSFNRCKHCNEMFPDDTGSDTCYECKIDRLRIKGQCPYCKQYLELDIFESVCTHKLPPCGLLSSSKDIREFAFKCILTYEDNGMRAPYQSINGFPSNRMLKE